jgi:hypothetical protein
MVSKAGSESQFILDRKPTQIIGSESFSVSLSLCLSVSLFLCGYYRIRYASTVVVLGEFVGRERREVIPSHQEGLDPNSTGGPGIYARSILLYVETQAPYVRAIVQNRIVACSRQSFRNSSLSPFELIINSFSTWTLFPQVS